MRNFIELVFPVLCISLALCSSITIEVKFGNPCIDDNMQQHKTIECLHNSDCPKNAKCQNFEVCKCEEDYAKVSDNRGSFQCFKIPKNLGDSCVRTSQCEFSLGVGAECQGQICVCSNRSYFFEATNKCYKSSGIGESCKTNHNCQATTKLHVCENGRCNCTMNYHLSADKQSCLPDTSLNENCTRDDECIARRSLCRNNKCRCTDDSIQSANELQCLEIAKAFEDSCEEDIQCQSLSKYAECSEKKKCTCMLNSKRFGSTCQREINPDMIGKSCTKSSQCFQPVSKTDLNIDEVTRIACLNGKCTCAQDYTLTEDERNCIRYSDGGSAKVMVNYSLLIFIVLRLTFSIIM